MSIDAGAQVAIILLACRPCVVIVNCLGQVLYLGRAPRTKETLPDFRECRVGYSTSTSIPRVDGLSTDTPVLGRHISATPFCYGVYDAVNCLLIPCSVQNSLNLVM